MNATRPHITYRLRLLAIFLGTALFFWLPFEDSSENLIIFFAIAICFWIATIPLSRFRKQSPFPFFSFILVGILAGATVTPLAISLIIFKTGLHSHPVLENPNQQIISIIHRTPIWIIGGFLISAGLGTWLKNCQTIPESHHAPE